MNTFFEFLGSAAFRFLMIGLWSFILIVWTTTYSKTGKGLGWMFFSFFFIIWNAYSLWGN